jgi:hypothetical protein
VIKKVLTLETRSDIKERERVNNMTNVVSIIPNNKTIQTLDQPHSRVSEKYQLIPTKDIAQKFFDLGFKVDEYKSVRVRDASRQGYQKHFVRLSHDTLLRTSHNDVKLQLLVTNSHDGSSSFKLQLGIFRLVCSNGLVVGTTFETVTIRHTRKALIEIEPAIEKIVAQVQKLDRYLSAMKTVRLTEKQITEFYNKAIALRWENKTVQDVVISARRPEDDGTDLFRVYNIAQEHILRGTQTLTTQNRWRNARAIRSIDKDITLNTKLFDIACEYLDEALVA